MTTEHRTDGVLTLVTGASRSGKSSAVMLECLNALPLLVWDVEGQWRAMGQACAVSLGQAARLTRERWFGRYALTLEPTADNFTAFCGLAFVWAQLLPQAWIVVEELADVTQPGKAPPAWGVLVRRGLKYGARIYAITQAPAESDKTVVRNAQRKLCFRMELEVDRQRMAAALDTPIARVAELHPLEYLYKELGALAVPRKLEPAALRGLASSHSVRSFKD